MLLCFFGKGLIGLRTDGNGLSGEFQRGMGFGRYTVLSIEVLIEI